MTMCYTKGLLPLVLFTISATGLAQGNFSTLGESAVAINHKVSKGYGINFALKSRYLLYDGDGVQYHQQQVDIVHFSTFKLNFNHTISFGVQFRNKDWFETDRGNELRLTEQFNYTKGKRGVRFGHRLRTEQRILDGKTVFRQRYRFAVDFPLNGEKLDIGEAYLVNALEGLLCLSKPDKPKTDLRLSSQMGWQINQTLKLQAGLEYRLKAFNLIAAHDLFVLTSAVLRI